MTYTRALQIAGVHSAPTFLKMDIEGYECVHTPSPDESGLSCRGGE